MWLLEFIRCVVSRCMQVASDSHALKALPQPSGHSTVERLYVGIEGAGPKHTRAQKIQKKARNNGALSMRRARGILRHYMLYDECNHIKRQHHGQLNVIHTVLC